MKARILKGVTHTCTECDMTHDGPREERQAWFDCDGDFWKFVSDEYPDEDSANQACDYDPVTEETAYICARGYITRDEDEVKNNNFQLCGVCGTRYSDSERGAELAEECCM